MNATIDAAKYTASLTGEPFLFNETRALATFLVSGEDLELLRKRNLAENIIMHKKAGSLKRVNTPIFRRLSVISPNAMRILVGPDVEAARLVLLVAIAKTDRLVHDFLTEVYIDKLVLKANTINKSDIELYFESVYVLEPYIRDRSEQTKAKLKQQLMKIMTEAGLTTKQGSAFLVTRPNITNKLANQFVADGDSEYIKVLWG